MPGFSPEFRPGADSSGNNDMGAFTRESREVSASSAADSKFDFITLTSGLYVSSSPLVLGASTV
jgi:hypothetical protein